METCGVFVGGIGESVGRDRVGVGVWVRVHVGVGLSDPVTAGVLVCVGVGVGVGVSVGGIDGVEGGAPRAVTRKIIMSPSNRSAKTQPLNTIVSCKRFLGNRFLIGSFQYIAALATLSSLHRFDFTHDLFEVNRNCSDDQRRI